MDKIRVGDTFVSREEGTRIPFDEVFLDDTKNGTKLQTSEYKEFGKNLIIDQGQSQIAGYTDLEDGVYNNLPVVVFGDHTRIIKYVDKPFFIGADGVKVLRSRFTNANYKYLYYALKNAKIPNTGYNRHFKWLKDLTFEFPSAEKQNEIVNLLDKLSSVILVRQQELQKLEDLIKGRFVEMFGDPILNDKNFPTEKLSKICPVNKYKGEVEKTDGKVWTLNLDMIESNTGRIIDYIYCSENEVPSSTIKFNTNCVLYSKLRPYLNKVVIPSKSGYGTSELLSLDSTKINKYYLAALLMQKSFVDFANGTSYGAKMPRASVDNIKDFDLMIPPQDVQCQFEDFIKQVDKSKVAVQKSLKEAQLLFDSLMQKYFG